MQSKDMTMVDLLNDILENSNTEDERDIFLDGRYPYISSIFNTLKLNPKIILTVKDCTIKDNNMILVIKSEHMAEIEKCLEPHDNISIEGMKIICKEVC